MRTSLQKSRLRKPATLQSNLEARREAWLHCSNRLPSEGGTCSTSHLQKRPTRCHKKIQTRLSSQSLTSKKGKTKAAFPPLGERRKLRKERALPAQVE